MDSPTQPILAGFMALRDSSSRRAVFNDILDKLSPHEIREVKSRLEPITFQCDLLDKLPIELVAMLAKYLDLVDLILLRRVSKRWRELLSSTIVLTTAIGYHMGKSVIKPDYCTSAGFDTLIKKRIQAERGVPAVVATIPNNLSPDFEGGLNRDGISCFNGVCAWIEESKDRTSIFMVHLPTGQNRTLTTVNREEFTHVQVSDTLLSAISVRGYCHVWNMPKEQYKSFRIPSLQFVHCVSIGSKIMLSYADSVVHFCFESGIARYIKIGPFILLLSVHAEEDGFSVVCARRKNGDNIQPWQDGYLHWEEHHLQTQKFSVHDTRFVCIWEQYHELPFRHDEYWGFQCKQEKATRPYRVCPGQSSTLLEYCTDGYGASISRYRTDDPYPRYDFEHGSFSLSLEADDLITVYFRPEELDFRYPHANLDYSARGPGLIYCFEDHPFSTKMKLRIGRESPEVSYGPGTRACRFESLRTVRFPDNRSCTSVLGDGDFVLFPSGDKIWIWCFDEAWLPSGIPSMRIGTW
ncbi:hypothetical protein N7489_009294 [Penicillium chrysogenum]|uniref:F-box domain-containing protein n=1 Tax=Penicillium chrysogenum TaxID=5076 RepID=A0ABQ8WXY9_PENCH|nr:uncharacterized protein N7489_009294 [Penicillium chrysogenum]KAJ5228586.1 hypothetical protein N7489_009294 [Penicillium chrysogenum]KAJ5283781.1 hypothetical protein N7505_001761 [Penicillium chrysogenum]